MSGISTSGGLARTSTCVAEGSSPESSAGFSHPRGALFDAGRRFTRAQRSAAADGEEADEKGSHQQNDANDQPQSCRIHRLILGEDGPVARLSDRGWTRSA